MALTWDQSTFETFYRIPAWRWGVRAIGPMPSGGFWVPTFHYHYTTVGVGAFAVMQRAMALPGAASVSDIAVVGGGFGWGAEAIASLGINVISVDTSPYVLANANTTEEAELRALLTAQGFDPDNLPPFVDPANPNADYTTAQVWATWLAGRPARAQVQVVDEDLSTNQSRQAVKNALPGNLDLIFSELSLDAFENDSEALVFASRCEALRPNPNVNVVHIVVDEPMQAGRPNQVHTLEEWHSLLVANGMNHIVVKHSATEGVYIDNSGTRKTF